MKAIVKLLPCLCLALLLCSSVARAQYDGTEDDTTFTQVGDRAPAFSVHELSGPTFSLAQEKGKVTLVTFWATWCVPCQLEMIRMDKEIWDAYKKFPDFAMIAIAYRQSKDTVFKYQQKHPEYTFPFAFDPDGVVYGDFADSGIPRSYVIDRQGKICFQDEGYDTETIADMDDAIRKALLSK